MKRAHRRDAENAEGKKAHELFLFLVPIRQFVGNLFRLLCVLRVSAVNLFPSAV
jgi:hypothetical protein